MRIRLLEVTIINIKYFIMYLYKYTIKSKQTRVFKN